MSNAIKIGNKTESGGNKKKPMVSQSIPTHFYKNYIPPQTPTIKPMAPPAIPIFENLPKVNASNLSDTTKAPSMSLRERYPMSMPVSQMSGINSTPFNVKAYANALKDTPEIKEEPSSLEKKNKELKVGSFTCFDVMAGSTLKRLAEQPDVVKDNASATSASTFDDKTKPASDDDEEPDDEDENDGAFDMEL